MSAQILSVKVLALQNGDAIDGYGNSQKLRITLETAGSGPFLVMRTDRWSMDHPDEVYGLLKRVWTQCAPLFEEFDDDTPG